MKRKVLEYIISEDLPKGVVTQKTIINTLNPHSYCLSKKDSLFKKALLSSDILLVDGIGVVFASGVLNGKRVKRITGSDAHQHFLSQAQDQGLKVFYLGASKSTINKIKIKISKNYPAVKCEGYSPVYKEDFTYPDTQRMIKAVNDFEPDILFIGMTAPKQEKWSYENKQRLDVKTIVSIGAVFDFFSGNVKRAPKLFRIIGLEWLYRLLLEPNRLWRRYIINNFLFCYYVLCEKIKPRYDQF
jgi:N-acetylglucosaminyldiphosphoundecaprenol N-acetyl-beta-D-mannosaminyltransferase